MPANQQYLAAGQTQSLPEGAATVLHVVNGLLWLTQSGDANDHFVAAGQSIALRGSRVVVQAEGGRAAAYLVRKASERSNPAAPKRQLNAANAMAASLSPAQPPG